MKRILTGIMMGCFIMAMAGLASAAEYVGSKDSNKYHVATCGIAKNIKAENLVTFKSEAEAVKAGYTPCKICIKKDQKEAVYIGSKDSDKYHLPECRIVAKIADDKKVSFASKEEAAKAGYKPCQLCLGSDKQDVKEATKEEKSETKSKKKTSK